LSHSTTAKTKFCDESVLIGALEDLWPEATILRNATVRGYPGRTAPQADIVVRFRDPTKEQQGEYDLGFNKDAQGNYAMTAEYGYRQGSYGICGYEEVLAKTELAGQAGVRDLLTESYVKSAARIAIQNSPDLAGFIMGDVENTTVEVDGVKKKAKRLTLTGGLAGGGWV
jgi:hypothetical protein